jgi:hypothetical protein
MIELSPNSKNKIQLTAEIGIEEGIYPDLHNEYYHGDKESISRSALMDFIKSPYHYWANHINPYRPPKESTDAMEFGSAFHTFVLEPDKFYDEYGMEPPKVLLKDVGEDIYRTYKNKCDELAKSDKKIITAQIYALSVFMKDALLKDENAKGLIENATYEQSYFWEDKATGLMLKCRPDIQHANMIVDLKTVASAEERVIQREVFDRGYDIQAAMIRDGIFETTGKRIDNFILLCVEKKYPYCIGIYILDEEVLNRADIVYKQKLLELKQCQEANEWPSYPIATIGLPKWMS